MMQNPVPPRLADEYLTGFTKACLDAGVDYDALVKWAVDPVTPKQPTWYRDQNKTVASTPVENYGGGIDDQQTGIDLDLDNPSPAARNLVRESQKSPSGLSGTMTDLGRWSGQVAHGMWHHDDNPITGALVHGAQRAYGLAKDFAKGFVGTPGGPPIKAFRGGKPNLAGTAGVDPFAPGAQELQESQADTEARLANQYSSD